MVETSGRSAVPVILLTGFLGAGKTSLLNHLLRHPESRIGVVVNDFGDLNIDAGLVVGQVDEPFSISGGCICCLDDDTSLEDALVALANPRLRLDVILVEASGFAEPLTLARMVTRLGRHRFHLGGVIDVVDALMHATTVDTQALPPIRYAATTLVVVNKLDQIPAADRDAALEAVRGRVHQRNPRVLVVGASFGRLDPELIFDPGSGERNADRRGEEEPRQAELPLRELLREAYAEQMEASEGPGEAIGHRHARSVTVTGPGCADAHAVMDLLEDLPSGVYRVKGVLAVRDRGRVRTFGVQAVGPNVYVSTTSANPKYLVESDTTGSRGGADSKDDVDPKGSVLVVIGESFDEEAVRSRFEAALDPGEDGSPGEAVPTGSRGERQNDRTGVGRLLHYVRLHG